MSTSATKKVLILVPHRRDRSPSQRFRFEQYLPDLEKEGYTFEYSNLITAHDDTYFYKSGGYFKKFLFLLKCYKQRLRDLRRANNFDLVFIQREAFFTGTTFTEKKLNKKKCKVIYDFDDAIWLPNKAGGNQKLSFLKNPEKTAQIISYADMVFAGNSYLQDYAEQFNKNVKHIPTSIDTDYHFPKHRSPDDRICIGWTGTFSTLPYLEKFLPLLERIKKDFPQVYFKVVADREKRYPEIDTDITLWKSSEEVSQLNEFDIGIMPLPDDQWTRGKCGFKGLQYMALEKATVMSSVGVNTEIISHEINGLLADSEQEWYDFLKRLIENEDLRKKLGVAGRATVVQRYSKKALLPKYIAYFDECLSTK